MLGIAIPAAVVTPLVVAESKPVLQRESPNHRVIARQLAKVNARFADLFPEGY